MDALINVYFAIMINALGVMKVLIFYNKNNIICHLNYYKI